MSELGNTHVNGVYEAQKSTGMEKPNADTDAYVHQRGWESVIPKLLVLVSLVELSSKQNTCRKPSYVRCQRLVKCVYPLEPSNEGRSPKVPCLHPPTRTTISPLPTVAQYHPSESLSLSFLALDLLSISRRRTAPIHPDDPDPLPGIWNMHTYLYEGARQHNVSIMLHALALGADKNFTHENDHGRTPLIQTILSVSGSSLSSVQSTNSARY